MVGKSLQRRTGERRSCSAASRTARPYLALPAFFGDNGIEAFPYAGASIQHEGRPYRILYAFDPRRAAILLIGGNKTGKDRWYEEIIPVADRIFDEHVAQIKREGFSLMAPNFNELVHRMPPDARAKAETRAKQMIGEYTLDELRQARSMTQERLADILGKDQSVISRIEKRTDMYISTLGDFIRAMGGELEIRAVFPEGAIRIKRFAAIEAAEK